MGGFGSHVLKHIEHVEGFAGVGERPFALRVPTQSDVARRGYNGAVTKHLLRIGTRGGVDPEHGTYLGAATVLPSNRPRNGCHLWPAITSIPVH